MAIEIFALTVIIVLPVLKIMQFMVNNMELAVLAIAGFIIWWKLYR